MPSGPGEQVQQPVIPPTPVTAAVVVARTLPLAPPPPHVAVPPLGPHPILDLDLAPTPGRRFLDLCLALDLAPLLLFQGPFRRSRTSQA